MITNKVIIGLGNPLLKDEGIGIHLVKYLSRENSLPFATYLDLGTAGTRILHAIAGAKKAIFIDCAFMGEKAGTIKKFTPAEVSSNKAARSFSLHQGDLLQMLDLSNRLGECPDETIIFGIQPMDLSPGMELSPLLANKLNEFMNFIIPEIIK